MIKKILSKQLLLIIPEIDTYVYLPVSKVSNAKIDELIRANLSKIVKFLNQGEINHKDYEYLGFEHQSRHNVIYNFKEKIENNTENDITRII